MLSSWNLKHATEDYKVAKYYYEYGYLHSELSKEKEMVLIFDFIRVLKHHLESPGSLEHNAPIHLSFSHSGLKNPPNEKFAPITAD